MEHAALHTTRFRVGTTRPKSRALVAVAAGLLVVATITALNLHAVPQVPATILLAVSFAIFYAAALSAVRPRSRSTRAAGVRWPRRTVAPAPEPVEEGPSEDELVREWRRSRLVELGVPEAEALVLAGDRRVDVHDVERLVARGCPVDTAVRIVWPT